MAGWGSVGRSGGRKAHRLPLVWMSYRRHADDDGDARDLVAHGVNVISWGRQHDGAACRVDDASRGLALARRHGLCLQIEIPEVTERADLVREVGLTPEPAVMIGGAYRGHAIDRHLFAFEPRPYDLVIEPPVYNERFGYRLTRPAGADESIGHYYPDMPPPLCAEVVVPLRRFDGRQHLRIVPAAIGPAPAGAVPERDTAPSCGSDEPEIRDRVLYRMQFDLTGLGDAMLTHVGLAVYWPYTGTQKYWIFGRGNASARAESTRETARRLVRRTTAPWSEANGGAFPSDVVVAARFGDECFHITGHSHTGAPAVSFPLWDFSPPALDAFRARAGGAEHPRTWGWPEIYGPEAYGWWLYLHHEACAGLCGVVRDELRRVAPGVLLFRNTTRMGVFDFCNEHDGSGQELLARNLDLVHLDPYPLTASGYSAVIPRDMSYCAGLARRYRLPLLPWLQAHTYGGPDGLQHVQPDHVDRMADEHWRQGVDAVMWLGYGGRNTFPGVEPASWERAAAFHRRLAGGLPPKPPAEVGVLRGYTPRALCSQVENRIRNPADWLLQQWLEVWAVEQGRPYDVFELPPVLNEGDREALMTALAAYRHVVSTVPWPGAWLLGDGTEASEVPAAMAKRVRAGLREELATRGW